MGNSMCCKFDKQTLWVGEGEGVKSCSYFLLFWQLGSQKVRVEVLELGTSLVAGPAGCLLLP